MSENSMLRNAYTQKLQTFRHALVLSSSEVVSIARWFIDLTFPLARWFSADIHADGRVVFDARTEYHYQFSHLCIHGSHFVGEPPSLNEYGFNCLTVSTARDFFMGATLLDLKTSYLFFHNDTILFLLQVGDTCIELSLDDQIYFQ